MKDWEPHLLQPWEVYRSRHECATFLIQIQNYERIQRQAAPRRNSEIEKALFLARIEYKIRFWRTFRLNDLPAEIITNIFRYAVWSSTAGEGIRARLWPTWTCRHWRTIPLEDSTLWNAIWF